MKDIDGLQQAVFDNLPLVIYSKNGNTNAFEFVNSTIQELTGLSLEQFLRLTSEQFFLRVHPEDRKAVRDVFSSVNDQYPAEKNYDLHYRFLHAKGHYLWLRDRVRIACTNEGKVTYSGCLEASERKEQVNENASLASQQDFSSIIENLHEGIWQIDQNNKTVYVNPRMAEILGYQKDEMLNKSLFDFMSDQAIQLAHQYVAKRQEGEKEQHEFELLHKNGKRVHVFIGTNPVVDEEGNYAGAIAAISDISAFKETQQQLKEREELTRNIADSLPGLIMTYVLFPDGKDQVIFISKGVEELYQVTAEEAMRDSTNIWSKIHPDDLELVQSSTVASAKNLEPWLCEFRAVMQDGSIKWLCGRGTPHQMEDGQVIWYTLTLDETARKEVERQLEESQERFQLVLKGSNDAYWDYNYMTGEVFYSERWWELFGYQPGEILINDTNWKELVHPDDRKSVELAIDQAIAEGRESYEVESRRRHKDGHYIPMLGRGVIVRNPHGEVIRISGTLFDMSKIKKAEKLLRQSELKFRSMVEGVNAIIYTFDENYNFDYISPSASGSTGYNTAELANKSPFELVHPDDLEDFRKLVESAKTNKQKSDDFEYRIFTKDGSVSWRSGSVTPMLDENGEVSGFLGVAHNINELKEKEQKLAEAIAMKDKLFSIIGHDLKSPLNSILGLSDVMAENVRKGEIDEVRDLFDWIRKASQKSVDLLSNLLDWARSQTNELLYDPVRLELAPTVASTFDLVEEVAAEKNIQLVKRVSPEIEVWCDENMLKTILRNLLSNALKYTHEGGEVKVSARQKGKWVEFLVEDSGVGISEENLKKLFSPNQPLSTPGTKREKGTGLGLLLCKDFVEKQGGEIWAESEKEKGARFFFRLPQADDSKE